MRDLVVLNEGRSDLLDPFDEMQMDLILGGAQVAATCKKGYTSCGCKCEYSGPAFPTQPERN